MKNKLRHILLLAATLLLTMPASSASDANAVSIQLKDGSVTSFRFAARPVITFQDGKLVVNAGGITLFDFENLDKITFTAMSPSGIDAPVVRPSFSFNGNTITVNGLADGRVAVYSLSGMRMPVDASTSAGSTTFSIAGLPQGIYIIKTSVQTFKINKR